MKKKYIIPQCMSVKVNLYGSVLEKTGTVGGQSNNPVDKPTNRDDVDWSGKGQTFTDDEEENPWGNGKTNLWDN